jgi:hypothetical protein
MVNYISAQPWFNNQTRKEKDVYEHDEKSYSEKRYGIHD